MIDACLMNGVCPADFQKTKWGDVTLVDAEKRLLANALLDFSNERFMLLSESCIPVHNFTTVYDYLVGSRHSFVESYYRNDRACRNRYSRSMAPDITLRQWRKGSQWLELSRDLATSVVTDTRYYPLFRRHCRPSCYPDEHYVQTYVTLRHGARNSNRTVTRGEFPPGDVRREGRHAGARPEHPDQRRALRVQLPPDVHLLPVREEVRARRAGAAAQHVVDGHALLTFFLAVEAAFDGHRTRVCNLFRLIITR